MMGRKDYIWHKADPSEASTSKFLNQKRPANLAGLFVDNDKEEFCQAVAPYLGTPEFGGAKRDRTADLNTASVALSQLS